MSKLVDVLEVFILAEIELKFAYFMEDQKRVELANTSLDIIRGRLELLLAGTIPKASKVDK